jgi:hypothetical protein
VAGSAGDAGGGALEAPGQEVVEAAVGMAGGEPALGSASRILRRRWATHSARVSGGPPCRSRRARHLAPSHDECSRLDQLDRERPGTPIVMAASAPTQRRHYAFHSPDPHRLTHRASSYGRCGFGRSKSISPRRFSISPLRSKEEAPSSPPTRRHIGEPYRHTAAAAVTRGFAPCPGLAGAPRAPVRLDPTIGAAE